MKTELFLLSKLILCALEFEKLQNKMMSRLINLFKYANRQKHIYRTHGFLTYIKEKLLSLLRKEIFLAFLLQKSTKNKMKYVP